VAEAVRNFLAAGAEVTLLTSATGWNASDAQETDVRLVTYDYDRVVSEDAEAREIWTEALRPADVAVCTVHPPREGFHCSVFAARCIEEAGLGTVLVPKTGTIVPSYERTFYVPERKIRYHVVAITGFTRDYLVDDYGVPEENVSLIYQGTDLERFARSPDRVEEARRRYPLPEGAGPVLGCLGSFEERKAQAILLDAVDRVRRDLPELRLLLVGEGPDEEMLRDLVKQRGLEKNVIFFPFTSEPEYVFELLDLLVLSSTHKEGLPNVLLESLAMGVPVVATRLAGTPEVVFDGETGNLVEPGDPAGLAAAIASIWSDRSAHSRMAAAGRRLMESRFDKQRQFRAFLEHFETLAAD
jgi:glycosyltransferase involved in cell wall biosynthesis